MARRRRKLSRTLRYFYHRAFPRRERSLPVALSVAIGVWIGVFPTIGVALLLTLVATQLLRVPKGPGLLASFIAIPPTLFFFFYPLGYFGVGLPLVRPAALSFDFLGQIKRLTLMNAGEVTLRLWQDARGHLLAFVFGMAVVATVTAALAFVAAYFVMEHKRRAHEERRRLRRAREAAARAAAPEVAQLPG